MKKIITIFSILALISMLIFISGQLGCQQEKETTFDASALAMSFVAEAPPAQVNYGEKFPIYVDVKNTGGYDVAEAKATFFLSGTGNNLKNVETKLSNAVLLTKKTKTVDGATERIKFAEQAEPAIQLQNPFILNMNVDSCYDYATLVQTSICVGKSNSICKIEGNKIAGTSNTAAPLQVTSLTERIEGNKLYVEFLIENKGKGLAYLPTSDCEKLQINDINEIQKKDMAEIVIRSDPDFSCTLQSKQAPFTPLNALEGTAKLGKVTCVKILPESTSLSPIEIILSYKYHESLTKSLTILPA